jgi:hypothetical protein
MAESPKVYCRLDPINVAYLKDLAKLGAYGRGKSGVMRRFIERGIQSALETRIIAPRSSDEFGWAPDDEDEET